MIANELPLEAIARAIGTPYYCYSAQDIRQRFRLLKAVLPQNICYLYSLKANPNRAIVEILHLEGAGCEVSSLTELETAIRAKIAPQDIIFVGPAKSSEELRRCVTLGIKAIVVESLQEIDLVDAVAQSVGASQPIALRINPSFRSGAAKLMMSGKATQFGIDEDQLGDALTMLRRRNHVTLVGLHVYMGSRILEVSTIGENTSNILNLALRIEESAGKALSFVDIGGGFGVSYYDGESELDLSAVGEAIKDSVKRFARICPSTSVIIELGRYLVAESGVFVTAVRYVKQSKGKLFAICDGGSSCHGSAAGLGSLFRKNFPIACLTEQRAGNRVYTLTGPLCTPTDIIGEGIPLGEIKVGDLIGIFKSGAYGPSASAVHFLGFGHPAEVLVDGESIVLIRRRDVFSDELARQVAVPIDLASLGPSDRMPHHVSNDVR